MRAPRVCVSQVSNEITLIYIIVQMYAPLYIHICTRTHEYIIILCIITNVHTHTHASAQTNTHTLVCHHSAGRAASYITFMFAHDLVVMSPPRTNKLTE